MRTRKLRYRLRLVLKTRRGITTLTTNLFAALGLIAGLIQLYDILWPNSNLDAAVTVTAVLCLSVAFGIARAWPQLNVTRSLPLQNVTISIEVGDLFDNAHGNLVIGFCDTFDTDVSTGNGRIVHPSSVQAQFLASVYDNNVQRLDDALDLALKDTPKPPIDTDKKIGKNRRFPIGTVAILGEPRRRFYCLAYSWMSADLVAQSSVNNIWHSLNELWGAVRTTSYLGTVAMPLIGAGLARVRTLDRESVLKLILLSFASATRESIVCGNLKIVIHPNDLESIDMLEIAAYLQSL